MARRTLSEIYDAIAAEKANMAELDAWIMDQGNPNSTLDDHQTLLSDLTSASKVAIWRLLMWIVAVAIWIHEGLWYAFKSDVEELIEAEQVHRLPWYAARSKEFQYGDTVLFDEGGRPYYDSFDASKQIVSHCAAIDSGNGKVILKLAAESGGVKQKLTTAQMISFKAYMDKVRDAGTVVQYISVDPDEIIATITIHYDPQVLKSDGSRISGSGRPAEEAFQAYLDALDFNGRFVITDMMDYVLAADGVIDMEITSVTSRSGSNAFTAISRQRTAYAGYFIVNPDNLLSNTFTYSANV